MILDIESGCWNNHHDDWRYTEVAGIISMTTGDTQKVLELSALRLDIHRGCWNYQRDGW